MVKENGDKYEAFGTLGGEGVRGWCWNMHNNGSNINGS